MRALLDTHVFVWFIGGEERLSRAARELVQDRENEILISVASLWEIAIKHSLGKLDLERPFAELIPEQLDRQGLGVLSLELKHLAEVDRLPFHHRDPFDRVIAAQALSEGIPVISVDAALDPYGVSRIW
jgi:PIN domain nuclease of toxin-antitoxin system